MQFALRGLVFLVAAILFIIGLSDLVEQFKAGEELRWRFPIIFLGFGAGIPLALFYFPDLFSTELSANLDNEVSDGGDEFGGEGGGGD